jgi:glycosyltransferase involved in cell wall biosynthesis
MKILIISHEFPPEVGGSGVVANQFLNVLANKKHELSLITRKKNRADLGNNIKVYPILLSPSVKGFWLVTSILRLVFFNFKKYERIILNDFPSSVVASFIFSNKLLSRSIFMWHGSEDKTILNNRSLNGKVFRNIYVNALRKCLRILAVSNFQREKILKGAQLDFLRSKTVVQYAGVDNSYFYKFEDFRIQQQKNEKGFAENDILILSVGRINKLKGYMEMFNIVKQLPENYHWIVIGDGELKEWLELMVKKESRNNIHILGRIDRKKLINYYNIADIFFLFSSVKLQEAFGLVYIEAGLTGTPVLARKKEFDGTNEAINNIGWLIDEEKMVIDFLQSNKYLNINKSEILKNASVYSIENLANSIESNICN